MSSRVQSPSPSPSSSSSEMIRSHSSPLQDVPASKRPRLSYHVTKIVPFKPGAVTSMRMQNFMTYDDITYDFGPALNMIIGPNGSGKSTVVAGICLGLGFDPKIMGRADKVEATIKHGTQTATIEIALQGQKPGTLVKIKRQFGHSANGGKGPNDWYIDGKKTTQRAVQELVRSFNCQIDNLCQFLPQDKVASFARLKPVEMLTETLRTIGDGSLGTVHTELISLQTRMHSESTSRKLDEEKLVGLKARQEVLERDVARFKEREAHKREILLRTKRLPFARSAAAVAAFETARAQHKDAKDKLYELRSNNQPLELQETALAEEIAALEAQVQNIPEKLTHAKRKVDTKAVPLKKAEEGMTTLDLQYKQEQRAERDNKTKIRNLREKIVKNTQSLGPEPDIKEELNAITEQIKEAQDADRAEKAELDELDDYLRTRQSERKRSEAELEKKERELMSLDDIKSIRLERLRGVNKDAAVAVEWLAKNQSEFEHRVYNPVFLEIQVTDKKFARAAQHVIMQNAFTFTCQSRKDYQTFNKLLVDGTAAGRRLRLNVAEYSRTNAPLLRDQKSPLTKEELQAYGFDGYLLDCLDGHDAVLNTLCHSSQIHSLPIGTRLLSDTDVQRIEVATKNGRLIFQRYILGTTETKIFRSYGQTSSESQSIHNDGEIFSHVIDISKKRSLEADIAELRESLDGSVVELTKKVERYAQLKTTVARTDALKKDLFRARKSIMDRKSGWTAANAKLEADRRDLDRREHAPVHYQDNMASIRAQQVETTKILTEKVIEYKDSIKNAQVIFEQHVVASSALIQVRANKQLFDIHNRAVQDELKELDLLYQQTSVAKKAAMAHAKAIRLVAQRELDDLTEEERISVQDYDVDTTVEELEMQIEMYKNHLNLLADTDGNVLDNYEARAKEIEALMLVLSRKTAVLDQLRDNIGVLLEGFEAKLEEMRASIDQSFSEAFQSIDCLGEVRLSKPQDFAEWALEIWVQFRDADSLQMLTGERQSGGERSVSTIFYLMALQSLSIAPFRVVDEINQGMDPRNERRVHARMVEVACEITTSQYFLITPKLLTDLEYHPNMKVHCVTSGNLGRSGNKIGYSRYLAALRERRTQTQQAQVPV